MNKWLEDKKAFIPFNKGWVSVSQAARMRGCSAEAIHQAIRSKTVRAMKVGWMWEVDPLSLERKRPHSLRKAERYAKQIESARRVLDRLKERGVV